MSCICGFVFAPSIGSSQKNTPTCTAAVTLSIYNREKCQARSFKIFQMAERQCAIVIARVRVTAWTLFHSVDCTLFKQLKFETVLNGRLRNFLQKKFLELYIFIDYRIVLIIALRLVFRLQVVLSIECIRNFGNFSS